MTPRTSTSPKSASPPKSERSAFLDEMVDTVREEIRAGLYHRPVGRDERPTGPRPSLKEALRRDESGPAVIVELKHASPGYEEVHLPTLPPERFVRVCEEGGARALSVIPQPFAFGGSLEEFGKVARASRLPVLFKDFVVDAAQIEAAASHGASGVLLLARLSRARKLNAPLDTLIEEAHRRGLETLLEVHSREELPLALASRTDAIGVNARDLQTLQLDPRAPVPLLRSLRKDPRPLVGMSGVEGPKQVALYGNAGADAILVGTAFSKAPDPLKFLRSLRPAPRRVLPPAGMS